MLYNYNNCFHVANILVKTCLLHVLHDYIQKRIIAIEARLIKASIVKLFALVPDYFAYKEEEPRLQREAKEEMVNSLASCRPVGRPKQGYEDYFSSLQLTDSLRGEVMG